MQADGLLYAMYIIVNRQMVSVMEVNVHDAVESGHAMTTSFALSVP